jgi:hypothetical protein
MEGGMIFPPTKNPIKHRGNYRKLLANLPAVLAAVHGGTTINTIMAHYHVRYATVMRILSEHINSAEMTQIVCDNRRNNGHQSRWRPGYTPWNKGKPTGRKLTRQEIDHLALARRIKFARLRKQQAHQEAI